MVNYYEVLGLDQNLQGDMLSKELTKIQRTWQSRTNAPSLEKRQEAETLLKISIEAKGILTNPKEREKYDKQLGKKRGERSEQEIIPMSDDIEQMLIQIKNQISSNDISNALILAKRASIMEPNNDQVVAYLGYCYWRLGQLNEAIKEYETAIALNPQPLDYYYDLIYIHLDNDNINAAENYLKMVLKMDPNNKSFMRIHTLLLNRKGLHDETIRFVEEMRVKSGLNPQNPIENSILCDLIDAYEAKAFSYYDQGNDGYYYLTDLEKLDKVKEIWDIISAHKYVYNDPSYVDKQIEKIDTLYKKKFKPGAKSLFVVPGIIAVLGFFGEAPLIGILGILLVAAVVFFVPEPQWKINRSIILGQKTPIDHIITVNKGVLKLGSFALIIVGGIMKLASDIASDTVSNRRG